MADIAKRDQNNVPTLLGSSSVDQTPVTIYANPTTHRLLVDNSGTGGDVVGPSSSTDNAIARFDGTTGKLIQNSGVIVSDANAITAGDGTAALPSYSFVSASTNGLYYAGTNDIGISQNGVRSFLLQYNSGNPILNGPSGAASIAFPTAGGLTLTANGTNKDITLTPSGTGAVSIGGTNHRVASSASDLQLQGANFVVINTNGANEVARFLTNGPLLLGTTTDSSNGRIQLATHTTSAGGIGFGTDGSLYRDTTNGTALRSSLKFVTDGTLQSTQIALTNNGSASAPSYGFTGDATKGIYSDAANVIRIAVAGVRVASFGAAGLQVFGGTGSAAAPNLSIDATGNTGLFTPGTSILGVTTGGTEAFRAIANQNVLFGTTTDSSNGRIQLATHTASSGGIGFGTDVSIHRFGTGAAGVDDSGGSPIWYLAQNGTISARFSSTGGVATLQCDSNNLNLVSGAGSVIIKSNNVTALTLDTSQVATFAGSILSGGDVRAAAPSRIYWSTRATMTSPADGKIDLTNNAQSSSATITASVLVSAKTQAVSPYSVLITENRTSFTNEGATGMVTFTLPTAVANYDYTFIVQDADGITITANTGDTIRFGGTVTAAAGSISSTTIGSVIRLTAINSTEWLAVSLVGTWS